MAAQRLSALILVLIAAALLAAGWQRSPQEARAQAVCSLWQTQFFDGFDSLGSAWSQNTGGGQIYTSGGVLYLTQPNFTDRFPLVWRNDLFAGLSNRVFAVEVRLAHENATAYGSTVAIGNTAFDGSRYPAGDSYPIEYLENILQVHYYNRPFGDEAYARILLRDHQFYTADANFHVFRVLVAPQGSGYRYDLYIDGAHRDSGVSSNFPTSMYFGNPYVMPWWGNWTTLKVDYVKIEVCAATPTPTVTPMPPVSGVVLSARYPRLVWHGPRLGQPAQVLDVVISGGVPPYQAVFRIAPPGGDFQPWPVYTAQSNAFSYGPLESGYAEFGVDQTGVWRARVIVNGVESNEVSWETSWLPVHVTR